MNRTGSAVLLLMLSAVFAPVWADENPVYAEIERFINASKAEISATEVKINSYFCDQAENDPSAPQAYATVCVAQYAGPLAKETRKFRALAGETEKLRVLAGESAKLRAEVKRLNSLLARQRAAHFLEASAAAAEKNTLQASLAATTAAKAESEHKVAELIPRAAETDQWKSRFILMAAVGLLLALWLMYSRISKSGGNGAMTKKDAGNPGPQQDDGPKSPGLGDTAEFQSPAKESAGKPEDPHDARVRAEEALAATKALLQEHEKQSGQKLKVRSGLELIPGEEGRGIKARHESHPAGGGIPLLLFCSGEHQGVRKHGPTERGIHPDNLYGHIKMCHPEILAPPLPSVSATGVPTETPVTPPSFQ